MVSLCGYKDAQTRTAYIGEILAMEDRLLPDVLPQRKEPLFQAGSRYSVQSPIEVEDRNIPDP